MIKQGMVQGQCRQQNPNKQWDSGIPQDTVKVRSKVVPQASRRSRHYSITRLRKKGEKKKKTKVKRCNNLATRVFPFPSSAFSRGRVVPHRM